MSAEAYVARDFRPETLAAIATANDIIREYQAAGFVLTLRQLYYQHVARGLLANTQTEYTRLGSIITDGRLAGLIDWEAIEDRTRGLKAHSAWDDPVDIIRSAASSFAMDLWADQGVRPEVWIEKDALVGVIEPVCQRYRIPHFACRGYASQSEVWRAGTRFARYAREGYQVVVLHLGDHDPSGIDMTRDNDERLALFSGQGVELRRLALNFDQVRRYRPPPNPAKETDSRHGAYVARFGHSSWELDALDPRVIDRLIEDEVKTFLDRRLWDAAGRRQEAHRVVLDAAAARWADVRDFLGK